MKPSRLSYLLILSLMAAVFLSAPAHADSVAITLSQTSETGYAGRTVVFDAILTDLVSTVYLNGDSYTTSTSSLMVNDNPFLTNFPLLLGPGGSSGPSSFFDVFIAPNTPPGSYGLNTFTILGGSSNSAFNVLGSTNFTVNVAPAPEPGTLLLLASGLIGLGLKSQFKRRWF